MTAIVVGGCFVNLLACTEYTPVRGTVDPAAPTQVRVTLTDQGQMTVAPRIGLRAHQLEGNLQGMTDSSLSLLVSKVSREGGIEDNYIGQQLSLNSRDYQAVEKSKTSVIRSLLLAGVILASTFLVAQGVGDVSGGKGGNPPPQTK
ncbi:MAG TPA: hypothetical protein VGN73_07535 [Gemmatimonadaceae bacterium]|nr:hypothetical protein [Gemmatimonadaceae bacterium]